MGCTLFYFSHRRLPLTSPSLQRPACRFPRPLNAPPLPRLPAPNDLPLPLLDRRPLHLAPHYPIPGIHQHQLPPPHTQPARPEHHLPGLHLHSRLGRLHLRPRLWPSRGTRERAAASTCGRVDRVTDEAVQRSCASDGAFRRLRIDGGASTGNWEVRGGGSGRAAGVACWAEDGCVGDLLTFEGRWEEVVLMRTVVGGTQRMCLGLTRSGR
jgi:hypothetical protein